MIKKIRNIIKYRIALISNWYLRKIKYRKVKNKNLKDQIVRYDIYKQVKRKYSKAIIKNSNPSPKNNSNKIWICWFQGLDNAPLLIKKCISSIKKNLKDNEVIILTMDNYKDYVDFPDYILEKVEKKEISLTHFSDLLRLNVLIKYGGIWIDATVLCTTNKLPSYIYREPLFVFKEINLNPLDTLPVTASSWFIASGPNNNILLATRELLYTYWQKNNYLQDYFLFHICFKIATEIYKDEWDMFLPITILILTCYSLNYKENLI